MKSSIAWTAKDGPKTDRLEVAGGGDISSFLEVHWTLKEGDTLIKHQPVGVKTLARTMCSVRWGESNTGFYVGVTRPFVGR
jgi:hypothetical protein